MATVEELINLQNSPLSYAKKIELKTKGRDKPIFTFEGRRKCNLSVQYQKYEWLTGCPIRKTLFCFPCLIFKPKTTVFSSTRGLLDLANFSNHVKRHIKSPTHLAAITSLKLIGKVRIDEMLNEEFKTLRNMHNEEVRKNREMMRHHIKAALFLVCQGLSFRGHSESTDSPNRGNFIELIKLLSEFSSDPLIKNCVSPDHSLPFSGLSPDIQNDLIKCLYDQVRGEIENRIKGAPFISIIADDTTDISNTSQMAVSVRLVHNGSVFEHLIDLVNVSADRSANNLACVICESLESVGVTKNTSVIGQSYDGASNMMGKHNSVQTKIKEIWPSANFVHCYAHKWALVAQSVSKNIPLVSIFFGFLQNLTTFFRASPKRASMLSSPLPLASTTRWLTRGKSVCAISSKYCEIFNVLENISSESSACSIDCYTRAEAKGLRYQLGNCENVFLLFFFRKVFALSDMMTKKLQGVMIDPAEISSKVADYRANLCELRSEVSFQTFVEEAKQYEPYFFNHEKRVPQINEQHLLDSGYTPSRPKPSSSSSQFEKDKLKRLMYEIIDTLIFQLDQRFENIESLQWIKLFQPSRFDVLKADAFEVVRLVNELKKHHPDLVQEEEEKLRNELHILFTDSDLRVALGEANDPSTLLKQMHSLDLCDALPLVSKALMASQTIALTSVTCERTFSVLRRIKTYLRSTMTQERMKQLVFLSIETSLLKHLSGECSFVDTIIDKFASMKDRQVKLLYRK